MLMYLLEYVFTVSLIRNANKNWMRIQEHFFFGAFDPLRDYSVEVCQYVCAEQMKPAKIQ